MGEIHYTIKSAYDVGDIVVFNRFSHLIIGIDAKLETYEKQQEEDNV